MNPILERARTEIKHIDSIDINMFFSDRLEESFKRYKENLNICKQKFSEASVHDFRVSVRRLNSLLKLLYDIYKIENIPQLRKQLKKQINLLSKLRDSQVQILKIGAIAKKHNILKSFLSELCAKEEYYIIEATEEIELFEIRVIETELINIFNEIITNKRSSGENTDIMSILREAFEDVLNAKNNVELKSPDTIHKLRLAFKKFRYIIEHIVPLTDIGVLKLTEFRYYQTMMGNIQDNAVLKKDFKNYADINLENDMNEVNVIIKKINESGNKMKQNFVKKIDMVYSFWDFNLIN